MSSTQLIRRSIAGGVIAAAIAIPATAQARFDQNPVSFPRPVAACGAAEPRGHVRMEAQLRLAGVPGGAAANRPHRGGRRGATCSTAG